MTEKSEIERIREAYKNDEQEHMYKHAPRLAQIILEQDAEIEALRAELASHTTRSESE